MARLPEAANVTGALFDLPGGGPANGRIGVVRTSDMDAQGLLWHRYMGALAA